MEVFLEDYNERWVDHYNNLNVFSIIFLKREDEKYLIFDDLIHSIQKQRQQKSTEYGIDFYDEEDDEIWLNEIELISEDSFFEEDIDKHGMEMDFSLNRSRFIQKLINNGSRMFYIEGSLCHEIDDGIFQYFESNEFFLVKTYRFRNLG